MQGASEQCMHATEMDRSPGTPSLIVTTRRRFTPQGMSCSCLHAVTQALHSMQRSASHRNFIRAMVFGLLMLVKSGGSSVVGRRQSRAVGPSGLRFARLAHGLSCQAFATWQSVVLVSCIIVTES